MMNEELEMMLMSTLHTYIATDDGWQQEAAS
jgi:hypothetical protein